MKFCQCYRILRVEFCVTNDVKMAENAIFVLFVSLIGAEWLISLNVTKSCLLQNDIISRVCPSCGLLKKL